MELKEIWKPVRGFEKRFKISNHGNLISINGKYGGEHLMSPAVDTLGYKSTMLRDMPNKRTCRIHTLVAEHFVDIPKELINHDKLCVNHLDGDKLNNHVSNLEWTTNAGNIKHAVDLGLFDIKGENHHNSKMTEEKVRHMRLLYETGLFTQKELGQLFGVCRRQAGDIINRVNWAWLK